MSEPDKGVNAGSGVAGNNRNARFCSNGWLAGGSLSILIACWH
ncbi:hypothetical protein [uncultured Phyllobacterium sp.]|nr:hypothetical protein [uncultured Phyllobacterium sp.]